MASQLPTGVVTLLFTDVEGSTRLLRELGEGYGEVLAGHRRIIRRAVAAHGGVEVDTQGDAFFVAFARASDAVAAAADAQRALAGGPVRVRMGLHTGEPRPIGEGYVGLDVHRAARIAAAGHGGQVLLSQATRSLVDIAAHDLGPHRLRDLSAPERIFQLEIAGLPAAFPPLRTLEAGSSNLPAARTSFVGRGEELASIDRLLDDPGCRLLTLVGPGGVGKTRLALEAAAHRRDRHQHGVHFVPLAAVASPDLLPAAVAASLGFTVDSEYSELAASEQLLDFLRERDTLLVLDNFEHLVEGSALLSEVVGEAPRVELLATSRERLGIEAEWVLDVEGLDVAGNGEPGAAVRLFVERARQADPSFVLTEATQPCVSRICGHVDGLPLGIELAAAWSAVLPCGEIAAEIERGSDVLATTARDVPARHRSLRAVCDQSWRLLTERERDVFARLSVIRGSFTREAAAAVAGADLRTLSDLVGKSLVRRLELGRFDIHAFLRQYAAGRLAEDPAGERRAFEAHAAHYLGDLLARRDDLLGPRVAEARDELRVELSDLRAAAEWGAAHWAEDAAREVFAALAVFFFVHGEHEGVQTFERLVAAVPEGASRRATRLSARVYRARSTAWLGFDEAQEQVALECLPLVRELGLQPEVGSCLLALGTFACDCDDYPAATTYLEEAAEVFEALGDPLGRGWSLADLGFARQLLDDLAGARAAYEAGYAIADETGNPLFQAYLLSKLGVLEDGEGDYRAAMRLHLEAQRLFTSVGEVGGTGYTLSRSSMSAYCLGDYPEALRLARAGYEAFATVHHRWGVNSALCRLGFAEAAIGDDEAARRDLARALGLAGEGHAPLLALHALSAVGVLLARKGDDARAAELLIATLEHPAMPAAYRAVAQPTLDALAARMAPVALAAARAAAAAADVEALVEEVRRDLAS